MKKKILAILLCALVLSAAGCGGQSNESAAAADVQEAGEEAADPSEQTEEESEESTDEATEGMTAETGTAEEALEEVKAANTQLSEATDSYESEDGWSVRYNSELVDLDEGQGYVRFTYNDDANATNRIQFSYYPNTSTDIVLADVTEDYDREDITRSEGYFAGKADIWAFHADVVNDGYYSTRGYTAVEHNEGVLLVERRGSIETDEEREILIADTMSAIMDSFEFTDHEPQEEYDYVPGRYELVTESSGSAEGAADTAAGYPSYLVLGLNHTGILGYADPLDIVWYSRDCLIREDFEGGATYYYNIEGEYLYLQIGGQWVEYQKDLSAATNIESIILNDKDVESYKTYENEEGWFVYYDSKLFTFKERWDGVDFIYGESEDESEWLRITYEEDEYTDDILDDKTRNYDAAQIVRSEGYVGGSTEAWGFTVTVPEEETGGFRKLTAVEHNEGVLLFDRPASGEGSTSEAGDACEGIINTFMFTDHDKQEEYDDVPGKYILNDKKLQKDASNYPGYVRLREDHSGLFGGDDEKEIVWYSKEAVIKETGQNGASYSYRIDDETLYVDMDGEWVEFEKEYGDDD